MTRMKGLMALLGVLALGACAAQSQRMDQPAEAITGVPLTENASAPDAWSYMASDADLKAYTKFILEPPVVFQGPGSSYGDLSPAEVQQVADMFVNQTKLALAPRYPVVTKAGPGVARLQFTLVEVTSTVPYISTATRIIPVGAAINLLKGGTMGGGTLTGGVTYGIEARDSVTDKVLAAAVRHLTPAAFDLSATLGTMDTAEATAKTAAQMLRSRLDALHKS